MKDEDLIFGFWVCGLVASLAFGLAFGNIFSPGIGFLIGGLSVACLIPLSLQFVRFLRNKNNRGNGR